MSQETGVIFTVLKKKCKVVINEFDGEHDPFTISSRNFSPDLDVSASACSESVNKPQITLNDGQSLPDSLLDKFDYKTLAGKPLEEVDPEYIDKQTFLVIGKDGRVRRLSGKQSPCIFNPFSIPRRLGILILSNWHLPVLIGIALCFLCLSFVLPNYASNSVATIVWNLTRYSFGGLVLTEIFVNVLARGVLVAEFTYLRSPWDWFHLIILFIIFANFYWESLLLHSLEGVVLLKFIPIVPALKTGFQVTIQIFKNLVPVLIYSLLTLWILVVVGFHIKNYQNDPIARNHNCTPTNDSSTEVVNQYHHESGESQRNYELHLPIQNTDYRVHSDNSSNFLFNSSYNNACIRYDSALLSPLPNITFQTVGIITLRVFGGIPKEIDPLYNHFLYVTLTLIFGTFGVSLLTASSIGLTIFALRFGNPSPKSGDKLKSCLPEFLQIELPKCDLGAFHKISQVVFHPFFELFITTVICVDIALISWTFINSPETYKLKWILRYGQEICIIIYVVEFFLKICTSSSRYLRNWWPLLDFLIVIIYTLDKFFPVPILLKLRVFKISSRWLTLQLIFFALFKSLWLRLNVLCVLLLGLFCFRIHAATYISGLLNDEKNIVIHALSQSFLLSEWTTSFATCATSIGFPLCLMTWFTELIIGVVCVSVIFMTVINLTCDLISRPVNCCFENDNYTNLHKAFIRLLQFCPIRKKFTRSDSCGSLNQVEIPVPVVSTSNGGPKTHHHSTFLNPETCDDNPSTDLDADLPVRRNSQVSSILEHIHNFPYTQCISVFIIVCATVALILELDPSQRLFPQDNPRFVIDFVFVIYFLLILVWQLVKSNFKTLKSPLWLLDFLIVSASGFSLYTIILGSETLGNVPFVKVVTTLSCFRGFMLVTRVEWMKVGAVGLTYSVRALWSYLIGLFFAWICLLLLKNNLTAFNIKWLITGDENTIIFIHNIATKIAVKIGTLLIHTTLLGVFIGVTISELFRSELLASFMTSAQCATYKDKELRLHREKTMHIPAPKRGLCVQMTHYMTLTHAFDVIVMTTIFCDCLLITFNRLSTSKDWKIIWEYYPAFIICVYVSELAMKLIGWGKHFLKSGWNIFDSVIVLIGLIDILLIKVHVNFVTAETTRFLRILRIFQLQLFTKNAKFLHLFYSALLKVLPCVGNLLLLFVLLVHTYAAIYLTNGNSTSSTGVQEWMKSLQNIVVLLMTLPFYGDISNFHVEHTHPCWTDYFGVALAIYYYSYLILSYLILGSVYAIVLYEILKFVSIRGDVYSNQEKLPHTEDENENKYKHTNGRLGFLNCDFAKSPDDPDSSVATMLTPIEPMAEDPLTDEDKYPLRISANGYILHVEAIVTTV